MVNAGVSFKIGQGNNVSNSRVGMAKEIKHLRDDVAKLEDIVNRQSQMINQLTGRILVRLNLRAANSSRMFRPTTGHTNTLRNFISWASLKDIRMETSMVTG